MRLARSRRCRHGREHEAETRGDFGPISGLQRRVQAGLTGAVAGRASWPPLRLQSLTGQESRSLTARLPPPYLPSFFLTTAGIRFTAPKPDLYLYDVVIRLHSVGRFFFALQSTASSSVRGSFSARR